MLDTSLIILKKVSKNQWWFQPKTSTESSTLGITCFVKLQNTKEIPRNFTRIYSSNFRRQRRIFCGTIKQTHGFYLRRYLTKPRPHCFISKRMFASVLLSWLVYWSWNFGLHVVFKHMYPRAISKTHPSKPSNSNTNPSHWCSVLARKDNE